MRFVWEHADSFLHCVASPFHSFVTTTGSGFAIRCWLCSASADVMMGQVYGAVLVAVLVGNCSCACMRTVMAGWLVAWSLCGCILVRSTAVWLLPFTLLLHGESSKRLAPPRNTRQETPTINPINRQPTHLTDQAPSTIERAARETHSTN